jgi:hypothetical protein
MSGGFAVGSANVITVRYTSRTAAFHLKGPGVDRSTSVRGTSTVVWLVTLKPGRYSYGSGALVVTS